MAISTEEIQKSELLKGLPQDQVAEVIRLSNIDEDRTFKDATGKHHARYESDIKEALGIDKPTGINTYEWMKQDVYPKVKLVQSLTKENGDLKTTNQTLLGKVEAGITDDQVKKQLEDKDLKYKDLESKYQAETTRLQGENDKQKDSNMSFRVDSVFNTDVHGLNFQPKDKVNEQVRNVMIDNAKKGILSKYKTDFNENGVLVFRDSNDDIIKNPDNSNNPFTAGELMVKSLKDTGILDLGIEGKGAGTKTMDRLTLTTFSAAKTQNELRESITDHLRSKGLTSTQPEFQTEMNALWVENKASNLPVQ